ncbi:hypothetical protein [Comamonas sp. GB3 AK4-5]|uniref:hypothetical protein n=1 Tax=Comamonas sp. GB3 AK4-5 TaxID=3231487 RepID=UPI00351EC087
MPHEKQPPHLDHTTPPEHRGWSAHLCAWLARARAALLRAEQRITENFRLPPHGG